MSKLDKLDILLQWKRNEIPNEAFWDRFDATLQQRLLLEKMPTVLSYKTWLHRLCLRWIPAAAACLLVLNFYLDTSVNSSPRFVALQMPSSIEQCAPHLPLSEPIKNFVPVKNVIEKKNVASFEPRCFSF